MPTYDYLCPKCGHRFELFHSMSDEKPKKCPQCKTRAKRVPAGGGGLLFKGSGFYITDYRSDNYKKGAKSEAGPGGDKKEPGGGGEKKGGGSDGPSGGSPGKD
jgi:putative FmdB family regulatory protein